MNDDLLQLAQALKDIQFTMFTTLAEDGHLYSRPMATLEIDEKNFDGKIWFFTDIHSPKISSIKKNSNVNLAYGKPSNQKYVSVVGTARLVNDREKMKELWTPVMKAWFPEGIDDPKIGLVCVEVDSAELWDSPPSKVVQLAGMAKALATGRPYDGKKHQHHIELGGKH